MICSKCGFEFQGTTCPKCDSPAILVNSDDYERRKREWEDQERRRDEQLKKKQREQDGLKQLVKDVSVRSNEALKALRLKRRRLALGLFAVVVVVALIVFLVRILSPARTHLYVTDGVNIYRDGEFGEIYCAASDVIYTWDDGVGYVEALPEGLSKMDVISMAASASGKYFVAVTYEQDESSDASGSLTGASDASGSLTGAADASGSLTGAADASGSLTGAADGVGVRGEGLSTAGGESSSTAVNGNSYGEGTYSVYIWDDDGELGLEVQAKSYIDVIYVGDDGEIAYVQTTYLNEGLVGSRSIYIKVAGGSFVRLASNPGDYRLFGDEGKLAWIDDNKTLCVADISTGEIKSYAFRADKIYVQDDMPYFVYSTEDYDYICHYLEDGTERYLFTIRDNVSAVYYGDGSGSAFALAAGSLYRYDGVPVKASEWKDDKKDRDKVLVAEGIIAGGCLYDYEGNALVYVVGDGRIFGLRLLRKNWSETVVSTGTDGNVSRLSGTSGGLVYARDGVTYCRRNLTSQELPVTAQVVVYGGKIYYMDNGNIYSIKSHESATQISQGSVDAVSLWVGNVYGI